MRGCGDVWWLCIFGGDVYEFFVFYNCGWRGYWSGDSVFFSMVVVMGVLGDGSDGVFVE